MFIHVNGGTAMRIKPTLIRLHGGTGFDHTAFKPTLAVDTGPVLCHNALQPARAALGQQALAIIECLGMQMMGNSRPVDQVTKSTLAVVEMDGAQIMAVELHEIERPQHEIVFDALVHLARARCR